MQEWLREPRVGSETRKLEGGGLNQDPCCHRPSVRSHTCSQPFLQKSALFPLQTDFVHAFAYLVRHQSARRPSFLCAFQIPGCKSDVQSGFRVGDAVTQRWGSPADHVAGGGSSYSSLEWRGSEMNLFGN